MLPHALKLVKELEDKTVISADHGKAFGEFTWPFPIRIYGHPFMLIRPALVKFPWLIADKMNNKIRVLVGKKLYDLRTKLIMMMIIYRAIEIARMEGFSTLVRKSWDFVKYRPNFKEKLHRLLLPYAIWKIKRVQLNSLEELVEFSFNWLFGIIRPMQIKEEILQLLKILVKRRPKVILEIGTANGGTLFLFTRVASDDATIISIDLPGGKFGGGYPD